MKRWTSGCMNRNRLERGGKELCFQIETLKKMTCGQIAVGVQIWINYGAYSLCKGNIMDGNLTLRLLV